MAFDPTLPVDHANVQAAVLRAQFTALEARIAALEIAISGTAQNPNLGTLSEPPARAEVQALLDDFNALLNQLTRV